MTNNQPNLAKGIFPNPEKRGIVMEPVCWDLELHIWRILLDHLANGQPLSLEETSMLGSLQRRRINLEQQAIIIPEIEKTDDMWFTSVFLTMLTQVGVKLSVQEREQLIVNIEWFSQNYR